MKCSLYSGSRVLFGTLLALAVVGCGVGSKKEKQEAPALDLTNEIKQADALVGWIKSEGKANDLKRNEEFKALKGKYVVFAGKVRKVSETAFGGKPYVSLTVGQKTPVERINIQFNVTKELVKTVKEWKEGEFRVLRGCVAQKGDPEDDAKCDNAEIVPEDKYKAVRATIPDPLKSSETDEQLDKMKKGFKKKGEELEGALNDAAQRVRNIKPDDVRKTVNEAADTIKNIKAEDVEKKVNEAADALKNLNFSL